MKKFLIPLVLLVTLTACQEKVMVHDTKFIVVEPTPDMYVCPAVPQAPSGQYTQKDVALWSNAMYRALKTCNLSMDAIRVYIEKEKANFAEPPKTK